MTKINLLIIFYWLVFIIPLALFLVVNFYLWLFTNYVPDSDKMGISVGVIIMTITPGLFGAIEVWE
jgi:uncharacterized membrane protein (DUF441 family)